MRILFYVILFLQLGCASAQSKKLVIEVFDKDSLELNNAEIKVITTTGDESIYNTNENGIIELEFDCEIGYYITCNFDGHYKEKIKLMEPCSELKKDTMRIQMKSNLISH